jgi:hypothetical protein
MPTYILGNVLESTEEANAHPEHGSRSFHITAPQRKLMSLKGLPLRFEHEDDEFCSQHNRPFNQCSSKCKPLDQIGTVCTSWDSNNGRKWIIARLNDDDPKNVAAKFTRNSLKAGRHASLSLKHEWTQWTNGMTTKQPIEVSVVKDPRRPQCHVCTVVRASKRANNKDYKAPHCADADNPAPPVMSAPASDTSDSTPPPAGTAPAAAPAVPPPDSGADGAAGAAEPAEPTSDELMLQIVKLAEMNKELQKERDDSKKRATDLEKEDDDRKEKTQQERLTSIRQLTDAMLESVANVASYGNVDGVKQSVEQLAKNFPHETQQLVKLAHCASKNAQKAEEERNKLEVEMNRAVLKRKYMEKIADTPGLGAVAAGAPVADGQPQQVEASKKAKPNPYLAAQQVQQRAAHPAVTSAQTCHADILQAFRRVQGEGAAMDGVAAVMERSGWVSARR